MSGTDDKKHVQVMLLDEEVQMTVYKCESRACTPMTLCEQPLVSSGSVEGEGVLNLPNKRGLMSSTLSPSSSNALSRRYIIAAAM